MDERQLKGLLESYRQGTATPEELQQLSEWYEHLQKTDEPFFRDQDQQDKQSHLQQLLEGIRREM